MAEANEVAASSPMRALVDRMFGAVMAKDLDAVLACFADNATLFDPHYPKPEMVGKAAIAEGLRWGFGTMRTFGFRIVNYFEAGDRVAVEVATSHVLNMGIKLDFPQAFFIDTRDGKIVRLQAYEPYGPNGVGGVFLALTRLGRKLRGK